MGLVRRYRVGITLTLALTWIKNVVLQRLGESSRIRRNTVWDAIQFTTNSVIFVRLGEQLHGVASRATDTVQLTGHTHPSWLAGWLVM